MRIKIFHAKARRKARKGVEALKALAFFFAPLRLCVNSSLPRRSTFNRKSGVDLSAQRSSLISLYDGTDAGKAAILKRVAESQQFIDAEDNSSFVLVEYFGYLQRDFFSLYHSY